MTKYIDICPNRVKSKSYMNFDFSKEGWKHLGTYRIPDGDSTPNYIGHGGGRKLV